MTMCDDDGPPGAPTTRTGKKRGRLPLYDLQDHHFEWNFAANAGVQPTGTTKEGEAVTYPPQPGQPDPYGGQQPQQPGFPGSGPMPQQPGAYPGGQQYGQPGLGQPGFGGPGAPPPQKKKTGLIVGLSIAAVAVIGGAVALILLLTGDSDDEESDTVASPTEQSAPQEPNETPGAGPGGLPPNPGAPNPDGPGQAPADSQGEKAAVEALADSLVDALNNRDVGAANSLMCPGQGEFKVEEMPDDAQFSRPGEATVTGDTATVPMRATYSGKNDDADFPVKKQGGTWCFGM